VFENAISVGAVILAAGQSRRMGRPKLTLPWGETTVIEHVVATIIDAGVSPIVVVTGGAHEQIESILAKYPVILVRNYEYKNVEMLESLQIGIRALPDEISACLVVLGDQPQIESVVVKEVICEFAATVADIIVPSYQMKRGHPWLISRKYWDELLAYRSPQSLRDFLQYHAQAIHYLIIDDQSILLDLDTPEEYDAQRPARN